MNSRKSKQKNKYRKDNNRFKNLKLRKEKRKKKKENSTKLQKSNIEAEVYKTIKNVTEGEKKLRSLIRFHSDSKINNYYREGRKKGKKIQKDLQNKSKHY